MQKQRCPYPECEYETEDVKEEIAAVLLMVHSNGTQVQTTSQPATQATAKVEKVRRPTISSAGSSEEWSYFLTRWKDYVKETKLKGKDCEEQLRKDFTRNAGGSLTNKSMDEVMAAIKKLAVREKNTMVTRAQLHNFSEPPQLPYHPHLKAPSTDLATAPAARHHHQNPPNYHSQLQRLTSSAYRHGS